MGYLPLEMDPYLRGRELPLPALEFCIVYDCWVCWLGKTFKTMLSSLSSSPTSMH